MRTPDKDPVNFEEVEKEFTERTQRWETNQIAITQAMAFLIRQNERWPTKAEIAEKAKLSRPTVYAHLMAFDLKDVIGAELGELKFISSKILARMVERAMDGDVKAMRLSFEVTGILKKGKGQVEPEARKQTNEVAV